MESNQAQPRTRRNLLLLLSGLLLTLLCVACCGLALLGGTYLWRSYGAQLADLAATPAPLFTPPLPPTPTAVPPQPTRPAVNAPDNKLNPTATPSLPPTAIPGTTTPAPLALGAPAEVIQAPLPARAFDDLERLLTADYPPHDYYASAVRLGKYDLGPRQVNGVPYAIGDSAIFRTEEGPIEATLVHATDLIYAWVENGLFLNATAVSAAVERVENDYYPLLSSLFGQEWRPGMDNDPRFAILHLSGDGNEYELGYFTDQDAYPAALFPDSNQQEIIYLNMGQLEVGSDLYYGTLVHELQHLIQWNMDANEKTWLNEGLSQLAELTGGLDTAGTEAYLEQPDIRLNAWAYEADVIDAHYAASYLYMVYLWEQVGETAVRELARHPANGTAAVDAILRGHHPERTLAQFTADWAVANFLDDPAAGPRYYYRSLTLDAPLLQDRARRRPYASVREINQFGVHYLDLDVSGPLTLTFAGDTTAYLIEAPPPSGEQMWYAPPQDNSHIHLTAAFDLRGVNEAALNFSAWYDLEPDYDFAYVTISTDGGATWEILFPNNAAAGDYGPALNGRSADRPGARDGWVRESIRLNRYTGQEVLIRFEVLTDYETLGRGFALDDLAIPAIGYASDVETDDGRWTAAGFVRTGWQLPQQWGVQLIQHDRPPQVVALSLNAYNQFQAAFELGPTGGTLVITALTPFIDQTAYYWVRVTE